MNRNLVYHFVGIKGSGMSSLALVLHDKGFKVQGSDVSDYFFTQAKLEEEEIPIYAFSADNIKQGQLIIAGNAFPDTHEEIVRAKELSLPVVRYHKFIGELINHFTSVAVTGSHGKTTTTGLLSHVVSQIAPTSYLIGDGTGVGNEEAEYFLLEACEYRRHFLAYQSDYTIITNIDFDHPDYYTSIDDVQDAFQTFAQQVKKAVIACGDDERLRQLEVDVPIYYYGFDAENDYRAINIQKTTQGSSFDVLKMNRLLGHYEIPSFGDHNILNALGVIALTDLEHLDQSEVRKYLKTFTGVKRRFSEKVIEDTVLIDDYAHHPAEIKATINAAHQKYPDREIVAVFQPHTFSRTIALLNEFADALDEADAVYLCDIFRSARETEGDVRIDDLFDKLKKGQAIISQDDLSDLLAHRGEVIIFMGAGDIQKVEFAFEKILHDLAKTVH